MTSSPPQKGELPAFNVCDEEPQTEYKFHPYRKWRLDVAFPDHKVGVELQGATWTRGRHTRGGGYEEDCWKLVEAQLLGWVGDLADEGDA